MVDRGQHELNQLTKRLLLSRNRPKRQWLIERLGHIWSPPHIRHCSFVDRHRRFLVHAIPTDESISAVQSFIADPHVNVRIAVAFALGQRTVPDEIAVRHLMQLICDDHPHVRCTAVRRLVYSPRPNLLSATDIERGLSCDTWTVRWTLASAIHSTDFANVGWETLVDSIPRTADFMLFEWLQHCMPYKARLLDDTTLLSKVAERVREIPDADPFRDQTKDMANRLLARV
ncbi:HEAT repeat domain-containing protein [Rhodopirellula sp. P2]|uniref:HEAT repeat domain-containing protein n=1 Tax=Rhodopirellula sp. P2 TaxID=2127060 RepID=UPI0023677291|nr:HEAT repeat domain-containing protein [Rhodopirellula sp. P2]WDQ15314.1 HEAT repeat domain-containing protein [Rhodopirellula sp. P2]